MPRKHPKALSFIFMTEMWERVGFYTLMAILVLYMDKVLKWPDSRKGDWYGLFLALCYFMPLLGGWLGDRILGRLRTVRIGAVLMAAGYVGLALSSADQVTSFIAGLLLIAVGTGIFKVNMSVLVGNLYREKPDLKDAGFNIYYMGVNLGAMIAPLLATLNSAVFHSYNLSFWVSAGGLVLALLIFQSGGKLLRQIDDGAERVRAARTASSAPASEAAPQAQAVLSARGNDDGQRIATLITMFFIVIFFWVAFYQNGFAMTLFAERSTIVLPWLRPETYQFFEPFFILALTPLLLGLMSRLHAGNREPSTPMKIFYGLMFMFAAMMIMVRASAAGGNADRNIMSPAWLIGSYFVVTISEILISPMGQSFVSKVAPRRIQGLMMGGWFAATALGSYGSGMLGKYYSRFPHDRYFLILTGILAVAAVLVLLFLRKLKRFSS